MVLGGNFGGKPQSSSNPTRSVLTVGINTQKSLLRKNPYVGINTVSAANAFLKSFRSSMKFCLQHTPNDEDNLVIQ